MKIRQYIFRISLISLVLILAPTFLRGQGLEIVEGVYLDGQMRARMEVDGKDFDSDTDMIEKSYLRTRFSLLYSRIEKTDIFFQMQDSRNLGTNSGGLGNDDNLGVHQAYIKWNCTIWDELYIQAGRFEVAYGRQRVLGAVGWSNVGRTFDGLRFSYQVPVAQVDVFALKIVERGFESPPSAGDHNLYGIYSQWLQRHFHVFALLDLDHRESFPGSDEYSLARATVGGHYNREMYNNLDFVLDFAYQFGTDHRMGYDDISAYMVAAEFGYQFRSEAEPRIAAGFDITSGDEGGESTELNAYNNLYYTGHAFRGYMDFFVANPFQGLTDFYFSLSGETGYFFAKLDVHFFNTMQDYFIGANETSKAIGQEIDFTAKRQIYDGLNGQVGLSFFLPSDDWQGEDSDIATWFYFMFTADIK